MRSKSLTPQFLTSVVLSVLIVFPLTRWLMTLVGGVFFSQIFQIHNETIVSWLGLGSATVVLGILIYILASKYKSKLALSSGSPSSLAPIRNVGIWVTVIWTSLYLAIVAFSAWVFYLGVIILTGLILEKKMIFPLFIIKPVIPKPLPIPPEEEVFSEDLEIREFKWMFNEQPYLKDGITHNFAMSVPVSKSLYADYRARDHHVTSDKDYLRFATEELFDDLVFGISARIRDLSLMNGLDKLAEIHLAMAFTLCIRYAYDDEEYGMEWPKYPIETIYDQRGDCEDHAILCGVILYNLGHFTCLGLTRTHAFLGVEAPYPLEGTCFRFGGKTLYSCEVTPGVESTTENTLSVQFWLGKDPHGGADNCTFFQIKPEQ